MIYCDQKTFEQIYPDIEMEQEDYDGLARRASHLIDRETMGQVKGLADVLSEELCYACARLVVLLRQQDSWKDKTQCGGLSSASTDGYSESYPAGAEQDAAFRRNMDSIFREAFGNDPYGVLCRWL